MKPTIVDYDDDHYSTPWEPANEPAKPPQRELVATAHGRSGSRDGQKLQLSPPGAGVIANSNANANANTSGNASANANANASAQAADPSSHHNQSPRETQRTATHEESDASSLNVIFGRSTLNERHGNQSTTLTQRSTASHPLKRPSDDMQTNSQPETRPAKQPFSPTLRQSQGRPAPNVRHGSYHGSYHGSLNYGRLSSTSPKAATAGLTGHYHNVGAISQTSPKRQDAYPPSSPPSDNCAPAEPLLKQPPTRPITEQQLINEVKGIYAGLVMVERKCVDIINQQNQSTKRLNDQQWKALVALHRTLLQEHHDFFSASQHPSASDNLKKLAIKYAMPARMWRHGIHAFLELLRHRLPASMEHMLSFIYLAYSMMALLKESVPGFVETWIECLGDLARYRMAIEDTDPRDREIWSNVAKMWYNEAADKSPNVGRIQHHLAVLARPNIVEQLFYYDKALVSVIPFVNARESIMLLFDMFIKNGEVVQARYPPAEFAFVNTSVQLFTRSSPGTCRQMLDLFKSSFSGHMDRVGPAFKLQGPQMILAIFAALFDFGKEDSYLWNLYTRDAEKVEANQKMLGDQTDGLSTTEFEQYQIAHKQYWSEMTVDTPVERLTMVPDLYDHEIIEKSEEVVALCVPLLTEATILVSSRMGDKNQVPTMHTLLAILWDMSFVPKALTYIEQSVPWESLTLFLNTLGRSGVSYPNVESDRFPPSHGGHGKQLPEDFLMRGMSYLRHYHNPEFFAGHLVDEDERNIEWPSHQAPRAERCLWLGVRLAKLGRYFSYNAVNQQFETTAFAKTLTVTYVP